MWVDGVPDEQATLEHEDWWLHLFNEGVWTRNVVDEESNNCKNEWNISENTYPVEVLSTPKTRMAGNPVQICFMHKLNIKLQPINKCVCICIVPFCI
jgi:hypothetical protein